MAVDLGIFETLSEEGRKWFRASVNYLLKRNCILRGEYNFQRKMVVGYNDHWAFVKDNFEMVAAYFELIGYKLAINEMNGVIYFQELPDEGRIKLGKFPTEVILALRLIYDEKRGSGSQRFNQVLISMRDLFRQLKVFGLTAGQDYTRSGLEKALKSVVQHNLIAKGPGDWTDPATEIVIYPTILFIIDRNQIEALLVAAETNPAGTYLPEAVKRGRKSGFDPAVLDAIYSDADSSDVSEKAEDEEDSPKAVMKFRIPGFNDGSEDEEENSGFEAEEDFEEINLFDDLDDGDGEEI